MEEKYVLTKMHQQVLAITLNRPDKFNSFNRAMALQLQDALTYAQQNKDVRAVLITANGKAFCAGQDLGEAIDSTGPGIEKIVREHYNPIITLIRDLNKPVVCAVNGVAAGAGANIALACDLVVAAISASFIQAFSKIGLIPDSGGTFFLPRLIGFQRAAALMFTGEKIGAADAMQMGMVYKVFEDGDLIAKSMELAQSLSAMPTGAIAMTKKLLNQSLTNNLNEQLAQELTHQVNAAATYDYNEGVSAFLEKRKPVFKGE